MNLKEQLTLNGVSQFYISVEEMLGSQGFSARSLLKTTDKSQWLPLGKLHQMLECLTSYFFFPSPVLANGCIRVQADVAGCFL